MAPCWGPRSPTHVDVFVYGLEPAAATAKAKAFLAHVSARAGTKGSVFATKHSVTLIGVDEKHPHVQVILRAYKSPAEVLMGFDIPSCCVGFDGEKVWALPRARRAIVSRCNLVDLGRRSLTYESRLLKYARRGP